MRRLELFFLACLPAIITLCLAVFCLTSTHLAGLSRFMPSLPLIPIFYWGLVQAREMPYWFVFLLGLIMDSVSGQPLGLTSLIYIFFLITLHAQRKYFYKESFVIKWGYFCAMVGAASIANWFVLSVFYGGMQSFGPGFLQWLLTICCYPLMHHLFDRLYDYIHARRWQILRH